MTKKALFVIDVQEFFANRETKLIAKKINNYIKKNKNKYSFIIFAVFKNDSNSPLARNFKWKKCTKEEEIKLLPELISDIDLFDITYKNTYSLLKVSEIKKKLKRKDIKKVDLCGFDTDCCILATAFDLFDLGFEVAVLKDFCFSTSGRKLHEPSLEIIKRNCGKIK